jgi:biopolymer transport protein ExbD
MRKKFRFLTVLAVCVMVLSCFSVTAFAYADDTDQNLPVTEATQPEQQPAVTPTPEKPKGEPIDDEGNAYTRDLLYDKATNKQFITVQTSLTTMHPSMRTRNSIRRTSSTWSMRATCLRCWMMILRRL